MSVHIIRGTDTLALDSEMDTWTKLGYRVVGYQVAQATPVCIYIQDGRHIIEYTEAEHCILMEKVSNK